MMRTPNNPPAVSVVMAVRDGAAWLDPTLRSLMKVRRPQVEFVVVDDGSTDATPAILAAALASDPRFCILPSPKAGLVSALNRGLEAARAPWVARLDADDVLHPARLSRQLRLATEANLDVIGSRIRCFPTQKISRGLRRYERWQNSLLTQHDLALNRFVESPLVHPSVMFRAAAVRAIGGYRDMGWAEDYDLWLRLFAAGARFGKHPDHLTFWRDHPNRLTRTAEHCSADAFRACKVEHLLRGPLHSGRFWMAGTGHDAKRLTRCLLAKGAELMGWFDINPRRLGQRIHGAPVIRARADAPDGVPVLAAVGAVGGRAVIRAQFEGFGWREGEQFWCVS
ncbi:MAG: glycosyltransferase involved in cell wall biosynthesis [Bradymonadia bacterium]|jgi:glycosyltransferase involved in cell wall biosynthesis